MRSIDGVARVTQTGPLKKQRGWDVTINYLVKKSYVPAGTRTNKLSYTDLWHQPVDVESASCVCV